MMTLDQLVNAGFPVENWPEDLPTPGEQSLRSATIAPKQELYRYDANVNGSAYAMEVVLDTSTVPDPAEGVCFMLNQFAYLWRTNKAGVAVQPDGTCRRINF